MTDENHFFEKAAAYWTPVTVFVKLDLRLRQACKPNSTGHLLQYILFSAVEMNEEYLSSQGWYDLKRRILDD